jgi:hypothetical protein
MAAMDFEHKLKVAVELLEAIHEDHALLAGASAEDRNRLLKAAGQVARPGPWAKRELSRAVRRKRRAQVRELDERKLAITGIRVKRAEDVFSTPQLGPAPVKAGQNIDAELKEPERLIDARTCYVCKKDFHDLHFFYDSMCGECAELNWNKRHQSSDLSGRIALVTGSRVKIGYQAAIMLLRAGAHVIVTTRFPADAALRYSREKDFGEWKHRLDVHGLDLRHTPSVEIFTKHLNQTLPHLDFIINNACQTVRRPPDFYRHLMEAESDVAASLSEESRKLLASHRESGDIQRAGLASADEMRAIGLHGSAVLSQVPLTEEDLEGTPSLFPAGQLDADLQQVSGRDHRGEGREESQS